MARPKSALKAELIERMKVECNGMTIAQAAACLGVSYSSVCAYRDESGFTGLVRKGRKDKGDIDHPTTASVIELAAEGLTVTEIAKRIGVTHPRVSQIVKKHGIECYGKADRKKEVIERLTTECEGMTIRQAMAHLGVSSYTVYNYTRESGFTGLVRQPTPLRGSSEKTQRMIDEAPGLAARGMYKSEAARELGVPAMDFTACMLRNLPDLKWRDGRSVECAKRKGKFTDLVVAEAPKLAARGLTKSEAARELGVPPTNFNQCVGTRLPHLKWRNGRYGPRKAA